MTDRDLRSVEVFGLPMWEIQLPEVGHVFGGYYEEPVVPDLDEVADYQNVGVDELARQIQAHSERFTPWLKTVWDEYRSNVRFHMPQ